MSLDLVSRPDGSATHLEVLSPVAATSDHALLRDRALDTLRQAPGPLRRADLRVRLRVNNERLGLALTQLETDRAIRRTPDGWTFACAP